jgi:signal transduction histidine kinase
MKKGTSLFFILLSCYVILQFLWWGYHLIDLSQQVDSVKSTANRRVLMIIGEGSVFFFLLLFGIWRIRKSIQNDLQLSFRQTNFILSVTHELKTPLATKKILLQTLLKHPLDETKRIELLKKTLNENQRLELMIENILHAARLENKAIKPEKSTLGFLAFCIPIIERYHKITGVNFIELQYTSDIEINADPFMLEAILVNLLENAIKYTGIQSSIIVYFFQENKSFVFGVKDLGPGIPKDQREQIFEKFYRIGNEETRTQKGSGLGLYLVKQFVELHQGKVLCLENEPKGTDFRITLKI